VWRLSGGQDSRKRVTHDNLMSWHKTFIGVRTFVPPAQSLSDKAPPGQGLPVQEPPRIKASEPQVKLRLLLFEYLPEMNKAADIRW